MTIKAIILDGVHQGQQLNIPYSPIIKIPCNVGNMIGVNRDYLEFNKFETYHECMRAVDKKVVLYSQSGRSYDSLYTFSNFCNFIISNLT